MYARIACKLELNKHEKLISLIYTVIQTTIFSHTLKVFQ